MKIAALQSTYAIIVSMKETSLFSEKTLQNIQKTRKIFLKFAVWILIAELVFGAVLILTESWDIAIGRIQGTFLILSLVLFVGVNNFIRIEKGNRTTQVFALIGFISSLIWGVLAFLLMWEIVPFHWTEEVMRTSSYSSYSYPVTKYHMTFYAKAMLLSAFAAAGGFWISNVLSIKETIKIVKPLKVTAIVCIMYLWVFGTIITPIEPEFKDVEKLYQLAGLAGLAFWITVLAALIISKTNREKKTELKAQPTPKTEAELRAEIEEKVRREMMEKEVREKMEAEKASMNSDTNSNSTESDNGVSKGSGPESMQSGNAQ